MSTNWRDTLYKYVGKYKYVLLIVWMYNIQMTMYYFNFLADEANNSLK